jgi:type I restriction enzyme S subunit
MNKWPTVKLHDVLKERQEWPRLEEITLGQIPVVAKIGFDDGKIQLRADSDTKTGMILIRPGDLVVSGINAGKGAIAIYRANSKVPIAATIHYSAYSVNSERADVSFLWWLLRSNAFREILVAYVPGGIKTELKAKRLLPVPIPLPPLPEQQRIVARIEELAVKVNEARNLRQKAVAETTALLNATRRDVFTSCSLVTVELQDVCSDIIDNLHSNPQYSDSGIPCIRSPDVGYGTLNLEGALRTDEYEHRRRTIRGEPQPGDVVLVREGGGTGKCALVLDGQRFSLGQRVMMLRLNREQVVPQFFLHQLLSPSIQEDQIAPLSKGSASPHLNIGALRHFSFRLPPLPEQQHIAGELDALVVRVDALKKLQSETAAELEAMLPSILDNAFTERPQNLK